MERICYRGRQTILWRALELIIFDPKTKHMELLREYASVHHTLPADIIIDNTNRLSLALLWVECINDDLPDVLRVPLDAEDRLHKTLLSQHLHRTRSSSQYAKFWSNNYSKDALFEVFSTWVLKCKSEMFPPECFMSLSPTYVGDAGITMAAMWIRYRKTLPPPRILHGTTERDFDGRTLLMNWITYVNDPVIPDVLLHNAHIGDGEGKTAAMLYIEKYAKVPPNILLHDAEYKDRYGKTMAMYYIEATSEEAPELLDHSPYLADNNGNTLMYYAIRCIHYYVPRYEVSNVYKNAEGDTPIMYALKYYRVIMSELPHHIYHNPFNIVNRHGENLCSIVEKYCYGPNKMNDLMNICYAYI